MWYLCPHGGYGPGRQNSYVAIGSRVPSPWAGRAGLLRPEPSLCVLGPRGHQGWTPVPRHQQGVLSPLQLALRHRAGAVKAEGSTQASQEGHSSSWPSLRPEQKSCGVGWHLLGRRGWLLGQEWGCLTAALCSPALGEAALHGRPGGDSGPRETLLRPLSCLGFCSSDKAVCI